jgi:hypothetical protein
MAAVFFVVANVVIGTIFVRTLWLLVRGRLLPAKLPVIAAAS